MTERDLDDQRRVLAVLAKAPFPMKRRAIEYAAFGITGHMAERTVSALFALMKDGYVVDAYDPNTAQFHRCYKATDKGREQSPGFEVFHPTGAS